MMSWPPISMKYLGGFCRFGSYLQCSHLAWSTDNNTGARRRFHHGYFTPRDDPQQDQRKWITDFTRSRLIPAQRWFLDID